MRIQLAISRCILASFALTAIVAVGGYAAAAAEKTDAAQGDSPIFAEQKSGLIPETRKKPRARGGRGSGSASRCPSTTIPSSA